MKTLIASLMILASTSALASEVDDVLPQFANDNGSATSALAKFVISNISQVESKVGSNWVLNLNSLNCVSKQIRGDEAGACIITAVSKTSLETEATYAVLVGEADENGGMQIRKIEFLKQNN